MSDDEEDAPPLLNALTTAKSSYILKEVGRVTAEAMWDLHVLRVWSNPHGKLVADSDDEAALAEMTETHVLGVLEQADLLVVRAAADPTDSAPLLRRLRAFFLALLRAGYGKATLHANNRAKLDSLPSLQTDIERAFSFPAMVPETCEALVKDTIKDAVVQVLGHHTSMYIAGANFHALVNTVHSRRSASYTRVACQSICISQPVASKPIQLDTGP